MTPSPSYRFGQFEIHPARRLLLRDKQPTPITGKVFDVLIFLVERRDRVVEKSELMDRIWPETDVEEANLTQSISMLRKILGEKAGDNKYIVTVTGRGYQFVAPVQDTDTAIPPPPRRKLTRSVALAAMVAGVIVFAALILTKSTLSRSEEPAETVRLTSLAGEETQPVFSPDGRQVAFAWRGPSGDNLDIHVLLVGTGSTRQLTTDTANDSSPVWSPDGRYVAFHRDSARPAYFIVPAIGGAESKILEVEPGGKSIGRKLAWSPTGAQPIVLSARHDRNSPRQLVAVAPEGRSKQVLTDPPQPWGDEDPAFSPDGTQLAFVRSFVQLFVAQADGSAPRKLAVVPGMRGLTWTADSKSIIYASMRTSGSNMWRISASGGRPELVHGVSGDASFPSMSPDGRKLLYSESRTNSNIWRLVDARASLQGEKASASKLISSTKSQFSPQLSSDGTRIAFSSDRSGAREIWLCDADGGNPQQLTHFGGPHIGTPRWSPDGTSIVFDAIGEGGPNIYVIPSVGGPPRKVTNSPAGGSTPSYSRDGRWIYFSSNRSGTAEIWSIAVNGGEAFRITRSGGAAPIESYDRQFLFYSKFGEDPGLFRVPLSGGAESLFLRGVSAWGWWAIAEDGVWFIERDRTANKAKLQFSSFSGGVQTTRMLHAVPMDSENVISTDKRGQTVLLQQIDERVGDLLMVQGFR